MISIHLLNGSFYFDVTPEGLAIINFKITLYKPVCLFWSPLDQTKYGVLIA